MKYETEEKIKIVFAWIGVFLLPALSLFSIGSLLYFAGEANGEGTPFTTEKFIHFTLAFGLFFAFWALPGFVGSIEILVDAAKRKAIDELRETCDVTPKPMNFAHVMG